VSLLAWQRGGVAGGSAVVLVHSWAHDGTRDWQESGWVAGLEAAGFALYVPDLPGHAASADRAVPGAAEPAAWTARALLEDLARLGVRDYAVAGYADGGITAAHLAVRDPAAARGLVLVSCDDRRGLPPGPETAAALRDPTARVWSPDVADAVALARRDRRHDPATLADWVERATWPAAPRLGALRTPTLLVVGSDDDERRARVPRLGGLLHDAHLVTVPGDRRGALSAAAAVRAAAAFLADLPHWRAPTG
jgi:pimeloyl-ACP methyl ester carboxylesterase